MTRYGSDPAGNPLDRFGLSRPVWLLGWVSFFTDMASEMVYPLLPLFLTRVLGAGAICFGGRELSDGPLGCACVIVGWGDHGWEVGDDRGSRQGSGHKFQGLKARAA